MTSSQSEPPLNIFIPPLVILNELSLKVNSRCLFKKVSIKIIMMVQEATQVLSNNPKLVEQTVRLACFPVSLIVMGRNICPDNVNSGEKGDW